MFEGSFKNIVDSLMTTIYKELEEYCEFIVFNTEYTIEDIVRVDLDLGNGRKCFGVVCPKECVINGCGILPDCYFRGVEEIRDEQGFFKGFQTIEEIPKKMLCDKYIMKNRKFNKK